MQKNYNILKCKQTTKVIDVILDYFIHCLQKKLKHFATNRPDKKRVELFYEWCITEDGLCDKSRTDLHH